MAGESPAVNTGVLPKQIVDFATGEITTWERASGRGGAGEWRQAYDQDAADLERWLLHRHARRLLLTVDERAKRRKVRYSEFAWFSRVDTRAVRSVPVADRFFLEVEPTPAFTRLSDRQEVTVATKRAARYRVVNCCRDKIGADVQPEIWYATGSQRASFHQVGVCGSVWTCPICSRRINLRRQAHIRAAYELFVTGKDELAPGVRDGDAVMVTFTIRHGAGDALAALFDRLKAADRGHLQKSYAYKRLVGYTRTVKGERVRVPSRLGYVGRVSATEVTHGRHGWHPHSHQLWFFDRRLTADELEGLRAELFAEWRAACVAVGLPEPVAFSNGKAIGVDVRRALSAEEYLTKFGHDRQWGPERELAAQHVKSGRRAGRSAFQLLHDAAQGDTRAGQLFRDFADATLGRHQLEFSKGLRERLVALGLADVLAADEQLAQALDEGADRLGVLTDDDWDAVLGAEHHGIEAHGTVLAIAKRAGFDAAVAWIRALPSYVPHEARRARLDDRVQYAGDAERARQRFWTDIEAAGGVADLEGEAEALAYEADDLARARGWRELGERLRRRLRGLPDLEPQGAVDRAARLLVLGGGDDGERWVVQEAGDAGGLSDRHGAMPGELFVQGGARAVQDAGEFGHRRDAGSGEDVVQIPF